jgi:hypothetical protein
LEGFTAALEAAQGDVAEDVTNGMRRTVDGLKSELRDQVIGSGLGTRLANSWRGKTYPERGRSLRPAGYIWSRAPEIIDAFSRGAQIRPLGGKRYLWLPTAAVPRDRSAPRGSTRRAGPEEVELQFNQELIIRKGKGSTLLAFIRAIRAENNRGYRRATSRRLAQGRTDDLVLMFTLVPTVRLPKLLDLEGAAQKWAGRLPSLINSGRR